VKQTYLSGYRQGDYEKRRGYVVSVSNPQSALDTTAAREANVIFDGDDRTMVMAFAVEYLTPVQPAAVKDMVLVLDGPRKGQILVVQDLVAEGPQCVVSSVPPGVMFEISKDILVQIKKPEDMIA
jgi:accessory colonization factor AcfC